MKMYIVEKAQEISGDIILSGSKNAALPILLSTLLCDDIVILKNVPLELNDIKVAIDILQDFGTEITKINDSTIEISNKKQDIKERVLESANLIRSSLVFLSILLNIKDEIYVPLPGGDQIGERRYDIHLASLREMGAEINEEDKYFHAKINGKFKSRHLNFHTATTTGTENVIIAALFAPGKTVIENANTRPEVIDFTNFLNKVGAKITYNTRFVEIEGVDKLHGGEFEIMPGRDEALTYAILAGMVRGEICIKNFNLKYVQTDVSLLKQIGIDIFEFGNDVYISAKKKQLKPFSMATAPYPGINSDMQPLFAALAATIEGESIITDMRFETRFQYVNEFKKFKINIKNYSNTCIIYGGETIQGNEVVATDLRCGAALILLGCVAENKTIIKNSYEIDRGYIDIASKLNYLGCNIKKE